MRIPMTVMTPEERHRVQASAFVSWFVDKHVRTRILDGRPDRVFINTLTEELAAFLANIEPKPEPKPAAKKAPAAKPRKPKTEKAAS